MTTQPRILLIGKSGRLDCLLDTLYRSPRSKKLYVYSELTNPSLRKKATGLRQGLCKDIEAIVAYAQEINPDIILIGPEEPLALGVVDRLTRLGFLCIGPTQRLALLETSKHFTRQLLDRHGIPGNPEHCLFYTIKGLESYLEHLTCEGVGFVIKPNGLTGGKGVMVSGEHLTSFEAGVEYAEEILARDGVVLVEEKLVGEEFSYQCLSDGRTISHMLPVQDHKRAWVGDKGPNTGGMGSYSCIDGRLPFLTQLDLIEAQRITVAVLDAIQEEADEPYVGVLYGGFMATKEGVKLVEYNVRFGDPEVMNVLPRLTTDFLDVCEALVSGNLYNTPLRFDERASVCKYVVPDGYGTETPVKNRFITHIPTPNNSLRVYYGSLQEAAENGVENVYLMGSRAVAVVGLGNTLWEAEAIAEHAAMQIQGPVFHREDIGTEVLIWKRIEHMRRLRRGIDRGM